MKALILAGGSGTRLWPMSTPATPKQFLDLDGEGSMLLKTLRRCRQAHIQDCFVITNAAFDVQVNGLMQALDPALTNHVILEPAARNTAPALLLAAAFMRDHGGAGMDDVMLVLPSDHIIEEASRLGAFLTRAEAEAKAGKIVTFGIVPTFPETGFGYIRAQGEAAPGEISCRPVAQFAEKPDVATATRYVEDGNYFWNAGMFAMTLGTLMTELRAHMPQLVPFLDLSYSEMQARFAEMPSISIDYAVMEKTAHAAVIPLDLPWSDVGSWDSLFDIAAKDDDGNMLQGDVIPVDTRDCLIINKTGVPMAAIGLEGIIAVKTEDGFLLARRGASQHVRHVTDHLTKRKADVREPITAS